VTLEVHMKSELTGTYYFNAGCKDRMLENTVEFIQS
jgi:hypothetical protein